MDNFPPEVQHILAPASGILLATQLTQMADRPMEMHGSSKPSLSALSTPSTHPTSPLSQLEIELSRLADDIVSLQKQTVSPHFGANRRRPPRISSLHIQLIQTQLPSDGTTPHLVLKPVAESLPAPSPPSRANSSNSGRTFCACDTATRRRFLVDTGAQISVLPLTAADRRFPSPGLHLQAVKCFPISTFGSLSLTLNIGHRRSFIWIFVIADVPHAILGSDFLTEFDLLVDCRRARLLDRNTGLFVRGLTPFTAPANLSVLDTDIASPFRQLLLSHPNIINPQFRSGEAQHHVVHHIRTSGPPVFVRPR
nr:unnamed protein product [Spirometra erinaceieuropaei]